MMQGFPRGTRIGELDAPFEWILTHTGRFLGIVKVTAGEGSGYVLLNRGTVVGCFFSMGEKILRGATAVTYLRSLPLVTLSIIRYDDVEFEEAERLLDPQEMISPFVAEEVEAESEQYAQETDQYTPETEFLEMPDVVAGMVGGEPYDDTEIEYPHDLDTELVAQLLLGRILREPHVQAVTIFGGGTSVLAMGDINLESVVIHAEDIVQAIEEIKSVMRTGDFVHFTLQVPSGNIIIAPYFNEYLCILTDPHINLGKIRKILKQVPHMPVPGSDET